MNICPNPNDPNWKELVSLVGEKEAYSEFIKYDGEIPDISNYRNVSKSALTDISLQQHAETFFKKLKVNYKLIDESEISDLNKKGFSIGDTTSGMYDQVSNIVFLIKGRAGFLTTLHEFSHPLVEWIYQNNKTLFTSLKAEVLKLKTNDELIDFLNNNGYGNLVKDGVISNDGWKEIITTQIEKTSKDIINNKAPESKGLLDKVKIFWSKIKDMLSSLISPDIKNMSNEQIMNLRLNDLALFMLDPSKTLDLYSAFKDKSVVSTAISKPFYKHASTEFQSALDNSISSYKKRTGKDVSTMQTNVINKLLPKQGMVSKGENYTDPTKPGFTWKRVTKYIDELKGPNEENNYFGYQSEEDYGIAARSYGNQIDKLAELVTLGVDKQTAISEVIDFAENNFETEESKKFKVSESVLNNLYTQLNDLINTKFKDYIAIPQVVVADDKIKVAGRIDILLIAPDGKVKILDVKTTSTSTENSSFNRPWNTAKGKTSSKKERYSAQLTVYKGLAKSMGLHFNEANDLSLIPIYLPKPETDVVNNYVLEPELPINAYSYILNKFKDNGIIPLEEDFGDSKEAQLVSQIKLILQNRLNDIQKMPEGSKKYFSKLQIEDLINTINQAEPIKKLTEFINVIHSQFTDKTVISKTTEKEVTILGLVSQTRMIINKLNSNKSTADEALSELLHIKNINDLYSPILPFIKSILSSKGTAVNSEMLSKINDIQNGVDLINVTYSEETTELMADILSSKISKDANKEAKELLQALKKRLDDSKSPKEKEKRQKDYDFALFKLKSEEGLTRNVILKSLKEGSSEDIPWIDLWFTPAAQSSNELIATFSRLFKDKMEDVRQELINFERNSGKAFDKFTEKFSNKDNPAEFNKDFYEEVEEFSEIGEDGPKFKKKMYFVSPIDYNKYNKELAKYKNELENSDPSLHSSLRSRWRKDNFVKRPFKDITITNPITNEEVVIEKGIDTLVRERRDLFEKGIISENDYNNYVQRSQGKSVNGELIFDDDFLMISPIKFKNSKYDNLTGNKKQYYDYLISSYFKSQERLPQKMRYVLPSIHKSGFDATRELGLVKYLKFKKDELINNSNVENKKLYGEKGKVIPLIFNFDMNSEDVSLDLIQSIVMYEAESLEYKAKSEVADKGEILLDTVQRNSPYKTDEQGNKLLDSIAEKAGVKEEFLKYQKIFGDNKTAILLASYMDAQIYGKLNVPSNLKFLGADVDSLVNGLMRFASLSQVGGNPIASVANYLQANVQANIEAAAKGTISDKSWQQSRLVYDKHIVDYLKDFNSGYSKSKIGQLIDLYDPMQGEYKDAAGRKISKSMFKKLWSTNTWFFLQYQGEHSIQVRTMIAMMLDQKAIDKNGKEIPLFEAYTTDKDGKIKVQEGVKLPGNLSSNGMISRDFQGKLHALNKKMHGVYNKTDKIHAERFLFGRLVTMYKKFLVPGFKRRYKSLGMDQEYGGITEGYYTTFFKKLTRDTNELTRFLIGLDNGYFTPTEKENLRRARREMLIVALTGTAVILLQAMMEAADDDEKAYYKHMLFLTMRLNNELGIYGTFGDPQNFTLPNPLEMYKTVKNPFPIWSVTDKFVKLTKQITDPFAVYERDSGFWEKGDNKLWAAFLKFWGFNGTNFDPENSIKFMQMTTK